MKIPWLHSLPPRRRRWILWSAGLILFYTITGFLIAPPIIRAVASKRLSQELNREVSIAAVRLNPYAMSVTLRGLLIKDKDGQPFVSWDEVFVNFRFFSLFTHTFAFEEFRTSQPFLHVQVNPDHTLNFSDILEKIAREAAAAPRKPKPPKPVKSRGLRIDQLHITGAQLSLTDMSTRQPFTKIVGPLELILQNFATDPENINPYSFVGTTQEGEKLSWSGQFSLDPIRSIGEFALENISLAKYAPLYQDLVQFDIRDGIVDLRSSYHVEQGAQTNIALLTNFTVSVRSLKLAQTGTNENAMEVAQFTIAGANIDAFGRSAEIGSISTSGGRLAVRRNADASVNLIDLATPSPAATNPAGSVVVLLQSVTNLVEVLLRSTNTWDGLIRDIRVDDYAVRLDDLSTPRPVRLDLDQIHVDVRNVSNRPGTNLTVETALRWNTNGSIRTETFLGLFPVNAEIKLALAGLDIRALDPYIDDVVNLLITQGQVGMDARITLAAATNGLPDVSFQGDVWVKDFATVDGLMAEEFVQFKTLRVSGIDARLNPLTVSLKELALENASVRLVIDSDKTNNLFTVLRKSAGTTNPAPVAATSSPAPAGHGKLPKFQIPTNLIASAQASLPRISVERVALTNVHVEYFDRSLKPGVRLSIDELGGTITGLSSEDLSRADVQLTAKVGKTAPVEITGKINLLGRNDFTDVKVAFHGIELIPTSPYSGKFLGYRLSKGKLTLDVHYELANGRLKGKNVVTLDQLTLGEKVTSPDATKLPIKLALAMLKDRDGRIELDVPVEGSLADPEFRLGKVITRALLNVITKIVTSPFAALGAIFGGKGEEISYQDFAPGATELAAANREKLDALAKGLFERPGLQVELEASTDPVADRDALRRLKLQQQFRALKWKSLRKSERARLLPEQVELTPEEYQGYLHEALAAAPASPSVSAAAATASGPGVKATNLVSNANPAAPGPDANTSPPKGASSEVFMKGATALMMDRQKIQSQTQTQTRSPAREPAQAQDIERQVLETIPITESDYALLAAERAKVVKDYLIQNGKVEPDRVFLAEQPDETHPAQGSRVYLHLR